MIRARITFYFVCLLSVLISCRDGSGSGQTYTEGNTEILVDDTFEPIIDNEEYVFESAYPKADIKMIYKPENGVLNSFLNDSTRVAILSKQLSAEESKRFENKKITPRVNRFAIDAIALIMHRSSPDSTVTVDDIINVMTGKKGKINSLVFDNANSSTVRYLKELSKVQSLPVQGVYALKSNPDVLKYVYDHPGTIGVIGINWIEQPDNATEKYVNGIKTLGVKNTTGKPGSDKFYWPDQTNIALGLYPLTRDLYIINCSGGTGLGTGFAAFLAGERGQRIVLKSGLLPDSIPSREINIVK